MRKVHGLGFVWTDASPFIFTGPLTNSQMKLFLTNSQFAGFKFPDMSSPETLDTKFESIASSDALSFLKYTFDIAQFYLLHDTGRVLLVERNLKILLTE